MLYQGGETIRQLQVQSGCHIELDRGPDMNPNEKIFNIRGNDLLCFGVYSTNTLNCDVITYLCHNGYAVKEGCSHLKS